MAKQSIRNLLFNIKFILLNGVPIVLAFVSFRGVCQYWQPVGAGFDSEVRSLFADTVDNLLYCGGSFKSSGTLRVRGIAKWNGANWDSLKSGFDDYNSSFPNPVNSIVRFQNKIYVGGGFSTAGGIQSKYLARWNGTDWDTLSCFSNRTLVYLRLLNNELLATSTFTSVCGQQCGLMALYDGANWTGLDYGTDTTFGLIDSYEIYQGNIYVAGNLLPIRDVFMWDGTQAVQLGAGIFGGGSNMNALAVYQNELYLAGNFWQADGNVGDNIMKWDGTSWSQVGGGLNQHVWALKVYGGYLYAVGSFNYAGNIPASCIARWDGTSWSALGPEIFDNGISCIEFYNNELYVGGGFWHIDTLTVNRIAKYTGPLSISDFSKPAFSFQLSPNPATSLLGISFSSSTGDAMLIATDAAGREQFRIFIPRQTIRKELDISELASDIYFITLESESGSVTKKFVKE